MSKLDDALKALSSYISDLHADLQQGPEAADEVEKPEVWFSRGDYGGLMLDKDDARKYKQCISTLVAAAPPQFTPRLMRSLAQKAILEALDLNQLHPERPFTARLADCLSELRASLAARQQKWLVSFRIEGLGLDGLPLRFGDVVFRAVDQGFLDELRKFAEMVIDSSPNSEDSKEAFKQRIKEAYLTAERLGHVVGTVEVLAVDADAARISTRSVLRLSLDVLNFFTDLLYPGNLRARVSLASEGQPDKEVVPALSREGKAAFSLDMRRLGQLQLVSAVDLASEKARKMGLEKVSTLLQAKQPGKLHHSLLTALHWAGRATVEDRLDDAFTLYVIALESLLQPHESGELTYQLSRRIAHVVAEDGGRQAACSGSRPDEALVPPQVRPGSRLQVGSQRGRSGTREVHRQDGDSPTAPGRAVRVDDVPRRA